MNVCLTILSLASLVFPFGAANLRRFAANDYAAEKSSAQLQANTDKPPMFVLQIGISNYKYHRKLSGVTDVLAMRDLLTGDAYKIPRGNIRTLCDDGSIKECDGAATKDNIVKEFQTHLIARAREYNERTKKQAVILFEFSGHGSQTPDQNGDEKDDGKDETLVTVDSQDEAGKNFDITDDEIYELNARLAPYTNNIIYILDSCTSGSGTRGSDDVRGLPARKTAPVPMKLQKEGNTRAVAAPKSAPGEAETDMLPPSSSYVVLSAARAGELAQQKNIFECDTCPKKLASYGYLTYYLMRELEKATAATSYRDMMENIRRGIASDTSGSQNAQIEGNDNLRVFGELSKVKNPGIRISKAENNQIFLEAGALQGVTLGTTLDIYSVEDKKIATARVVRALSPTKSVADVISNNTADTRAVSTEKQDRAILVAPDLGALRLNVLLDGEDAAKLSAGDKNLIETLRRKFQPKTNETEASSVALVGGRWNEQPARWDAALLKDRFDKVFADASRAAIPEGKDAPAGDTQVLYLAGRDFKPLYGFYVSADDTAAAETRIEKALLHLARLRSVKAIANAEAKSPLKGTVKLTPLAALSPQCKGEEIKDEKAAPLAFDKTNYKIGLGQFFGVEIINRSPRDLYITLIDVGSDGSVTILAPRNIAEEQNGLKLKAGESKRLFGDGCNIWQTIAPTGFETLKVIATTTPTVRANFEFLQMEAISKDGVRKKSLGDLADWTTAEAVLEISSAQKKP